MDWFQRCIGFAGFLFLTFSLSSGQGDVPTPTFPDAFEVEVQGIFENVLVEMDGSMYYDRKNNRAALFYTYQNETIKSIYDFDDNELVTIQGTECTVSKMTDDPEKSFFPFTTDKSGKKVLGTPEEVLYFTNSTLDKEGITVFPSYIYKAKLDFKLYGRKNCDVEHIFTRPEVELPNCDSHNCQPTLVAISVTCPTPEKDGESDGGGEIKHVYNFFRFNSGFRDESVFQAPAGIHCNITSHETFPQLPEYFSFSYDFLEDVRDTLTGPGVFVTHKKVWYDSKLQLIRVDEFDDNDLILSSRIFDFYGKTAYTIVTSLAECNKGPIDGVIALDELTRLPKLIFRNNLTEGDAVYVGKRKAHGLSYDVWSSSYTYAETDSKSIQEFFFTKLSSSFGLKGKLQLSHVDFYMYERNADTGSFEISVNAYLAINNFRSKPKEWEAFDISECFRNDQRIEFRLNVTGPPITKGSYYADLLERLYMKLIIATNVSVVRISELAGIFDGVHLKEFRGWILDKPDSQTGNKEPDMHRAYKLVEDAAASGKLNIKVKGFQEDNQYIITAIKDDPNLTTDQSIDDTTTGRTGTTEQIKTTGQTGTGEQIKTTGQTGTGEQIKSTGQTGTGKEIKSTGSTATTENPSSTVGHHVTGRNGSLSSGTIAAISVSSILVVLLVGGGGFYMYRKRRNEAWNEYPNVQMNTMN